MMRNTAILAAVPCIGAIDAVSLLQQHVVMDVEDYDYDGDLMDPVAGKGKSGKESPTPAPTDGPPPTPAPPGPTPPPTPAPTPEPTAAPPTPAPTAAPTPAPTAPRYCSGTGANWVPYNGYIMTDIDTSSCGFTTTPKYFTSISGNSNHWSTTGATSIYSATPTGFRVYIWMSGGVSTTYAKDRAWRINWIGQITTGTISSCAVSESPTTWRGYNGNVYADVSTSSCSHSTMPMYLASLSGSGGQWQAKGTSSIYSESANHYRVYLKYDGSNTIGSRATSSNWYLNTLSLDRNQVPPGLCTGNADAWKAYNGHIVIDVDTTACKFTGAPQYFTSLSGDSNHWSTTGATSIYSETADGFRVYINKEGGVSTSYAAARNWRINWVAVE